MALDTNIVGSNIDVNGNIKVALPVDAAAAGSMVVLYENDDGTKLGTRYLKSPEVSQDYRLRVGQDTILFMDTFNATAQNSGNWKHAFSTMTMTQSGGFLNVNAAGNSTASGNFAYLQTWRYFPLFGTAPLAVEFTGQFANYPLANEVFLCGLGVATGAAEPIDGVWFEMTSAGLKGCIRYNSGTVNKIDLVGTISSLPENTSAKYVIVVGEREVEYWIDDVLYGKQEVPTGQGQPFVTSALPLFIQKHNTGVVGASPNLQVRIGDVSVTLMDLATNQTWANQMASCGLGMQGTNGGTMGSPQVQWSNTALPTAATATNTTAALGTFLGGIFQMNAPATGTTDLIIASYQNPQGGVSQTPRTIKLRGIKVECVNLGAAVATTATTLAVAVAWGANNVSLATVETGSFVTATAKARRIQPIGVMTLQVGAAIGATANTVQFDFEAPLVINPGEFVQVICKPLVGTATASQVLAFVVAPNLYQE
jgi:hypothetical protein